MDQTTYQQWWQLHLRAARGESLSAGEQASYEAGLTELDTEEKQQWEDANLALLRQLKAEVERLETAHAELQVRSQRLDRRIWTLEGAYMSLTGLELSSQSHVASPV
jgi:hypothetical protein